MLQELDQLVPRRTELAWELPLLLRVALALDDTPLARRLVDGLSNPSPRFTSTPSPRPRPSSRISPG